MISVGETLRRERLRRNLELDRISQELKISPRFLEAIEEEKFERLPGGVFAKSFVRQYARLLGLDEEELAGEVQRTMQPPSGLAQPEAPAPPRAAEIQLPKFEDWEGSGRRFSWSSSLPALAGVVVVMLVCSGIYVLWQRSAIEPRQPSAAPPSETAQVSPAPQPPPATAPAPPPAASATGNPGGGPVSGATAAGPAAPGATAGSVRPAGTNPAPAPPAASVAGEAARAAAAPPSPAPSGTAGNSNTAVRVEITATEPVWVLARADGKFLFSGTLDPNQTKTVEGSQDVILRLGNAGGVNVTLNGKPLGAPGPKGQVRTLQFTSGGFKIVAAPKPSLPPDDIL